MAFFKIPQVNLAPGFARLHAVTTFKSPVTHAIIHDHRLDNRRAAVLLIFRQSNRVAVGVPRVQPDIAQAVGGQEVVHVVAVSRRIALITGERVAQGERRPAEERPGHLACKQSTICRRREDCSRSGQSPQGVTQFE